jgi:diguanylate cyclase (GGDEF)-like protein
VRAVTARRTRLRTRVLLLTAAFALALFAITFGLSWRAQVAAERWRRLAGVETRAITALEEIVRAQNAFHARRLRGGATFGGAASGGADYRVVMQLLDADALAGDDTAALRRRMRGYRLTPDDRESQRVVAEAQRLAAEHKREIARQLPLLERGSRDLMSTGLAVAWIVVISSFAAVQITLRKVVRPLEELSGAADSIAAGDLNARAPVAGDREIARLGVAFNHMADELRAHARTDELTGLPNFRAFRERIDDEIVRAARYPERFGVLVLDLDRFKKYNDSFGHLAGNDALARVARVIREAVRGVDFAARYGGEEFAVIVPRIDAGTLSMIAERIRAGVEALPAPPDGAALTVSIGGAIYPDDGSEVDALFVAADKRLYQAKERGRNRVVIPPATTVRSDGRQSA